MEWAVGGGDGNEAVKERDFVLGIWITRSVSGTQSCPWGCIHEFKIGVDELLRSIFSFLTERGEKREERREKREKALFVLEGD